MAQNWARGIAGVALASGFAVYGFRKFGGKDSVGNDLVSKDNGATSTSSSSPSTAHTSEPDSSSENVVPKYPPKLQGELLRRKTNRKKIKNPLHPCRPIVVCGPSGAGKSTLIKKLTSEYPDDFGFSVSHTTRNPRTGEQDGVDYHFTNTEDMLDMIKQGEFIEHAHVHNKIYGTSVRAVSDVIEKNRICILDIDVQGVQSILESDAHVQLQPKYLFIRPVNVKVLEKRLISRATDSLEAIADRVHTAAFEMQVASQLPFDSVIVNDDLETAYKELKDFVDEDRGSCEACRKKKEMMTSST